MNSSRYVTGRVCKVVAGDSVKCKIASMFEKMVAQGSVVAQVKWSLTQDLLYCPNFMCPSMWKRKKKHHNFMCLLVHSRAIPVMQYGLNWPQ